MDAQQRLQYGLKAIGDIQDPLAKKQAAKILLGSSSAAAFSSAGVTDNIAADISGSSKVKEEEGRAAYAGITSQQIDQRGIEEATLIEGGGDANFVTAYVAKALQGGMEYQITSSDAAQIGLAAAVTLKQGYNEVQEDPADYVGMQNGRSSRKSKKQENLEATQDVLAMREEEEAPARTLTRREIQQNQANPDSRINPPVTRGADSASSSTTSGTPAVNISVHTTIPPEKLEIIQDGSEVDARNGSVGMGRGQGARR